MGTKIIGEIGDWLISSGALTALFIFAWRYLVPWIEAKKAHALTEQSKASWDLLEQVAMQTMTAMIGKNMPGSLKLDAAAKMTQQAMDAHGFEVNPATAKVAVQAAYEKSPLTPSPLKQETPQLSDKKPEAVESTKATNRANKLLLQGQEVADNAKG